MERVLIIGSNGAGKSTFSVALSEKTGLPLTHIDRIYWSDNWNVTPQEEFERKVNNEAKKSRWIIEGNRIVTLNQRLQYADTVFWFEFPPVIYRINIIKREIKYRGKARPDMPDKCISRFSFRFLKQAGYFNKKNHDKIKVLLENAKNIKVIRFTNYRQIRKYLKAI